MSKPFVTYIPKEAALKLGQPVCLISIRERYSWYDFKVKHNILDLVFDAHHGETTEHTFTEEHADAVIAFVKANQDKDIYVHCGEGRIRSPAIATAIARFSDTHTLDESIKGCRASTVNQERHAWALLRRRAMVTYKDKEAE